MSAVRRRLIAWLLAAIGIGIAAWLVMRTHGAPIAADAERATGPASDRPPASLEAPELSAPGTRPSDAKRSEMGADEPPAAVAPDVAPAPVTHVEFVDAETGVQVPGCELAPAGTAPELAWTVVARGQATVTRNVRMSGDSTSLVHPRVLLPRGYVIVAHPPEDVVFASRATSFRVVQPVHREVDVRVTFVDESGQPSRGGRVVAWRVGDLVQRPPVVETIAGGRVRLRGIPFVSGATLRLQCERDTGVEAEGPPDIADEIMAESEPANETFDSPFRWPMPASFRETIDARVPIAALAEPAIVDHSEVGFDLGTTIIERTEPPTFGSLRVELRGLDGRPLIGVPVAVQGSSGTSDRMGVATLVGVPAGSRDITVHDPGRLFESATAAVIADVETRLTLHEIEGGTLEIEVVDAEGNPAPFARIAIRPEQGPTWIDIDGAGEQRLDPFTDARGRRVCTRIAPGKVTILASCGDGHAKNELELRDGQRMRLRIELR